MPEGQWGREFRLTNMIWMQGQFIGRISNDGHSVIFFAVDGQVYRYEQRQELLIEEMGDYFAFMEKIRANEIPGFQHGDCLTIRLHESMKKHLALAGKYERGGNTEGARYLRYVGNLLAAFLRGESPQTILPDDGEENDQEIH